MKKTSVMAVAALVAAISVGNAAPASAQADCVSTSEPTPQLETIYTENGQLRINPNGPANDAGELSGYATGGWVGTRDCVYGHLPTQFWCTYDLVWFDIILGQAPPYVYVDPATGEVVVDYGRIQNDLNNCT